MASNDESSNIILPESIALEWSFETETENIEPIHHNIIGFVAPTIPNEQRAEIVNEEDSISVEKHRNKRLNKLAFLDAECTSHRYVNELHKQTSQKKQTEKPFEIKPREIFIPRTNDVKELENIAKNVDEMESMLTMSLILQLKALQKNQDKMVKSAEDEVCFALRKSKLVLSSRSAFSGR